MTKKFHFDNDGRYTYDFLSSGLFTPINKDGESLYAVALPLCEKLGSNLLWIFLWIVVALASNLVFSNGVVGVINPLMMSFIFVHLFIFGCRLTTLLIKGGFRAVFFPPLWMRLTRQLQKGRGLELLKRHNLADHPGLLVNLALVQYSMDQKHEGDQTLQRVFSLCPELQQTLDQKHLTV